MAGLGGILNIGYHGTSPANLRSISTSGFTGGVNPSWAGKGAVFTSTPNVSSTYGPRQIPVVQSAKNLTLPGGGIPGKTFTEALKNIGKTKFGFETALKPDQATKGMTALERMKGKYPNSPTLQRLLKTGTTAITNPTNWARVLGLPLSALTGILSSTPANAAEVGMTAEDFQNLALQNQSKGPLYVDPNLSYEDFPLTELEKDLRYTPKGQREEIYEDMKKDLEGMTDVEKKDYLHYNQEPAMMADPYITQAMEYTNDPVFEDYYETGEHWSPGIPGIQRFKQQFMNRRKQQMQQRIRQAEAAEAAEAAKQKAAADAKAKADAAHRARQQSTPGYGSAPGGEGFDAGTGRTTKSGYSGKTGRKEMMADGGLIDFFRYGGFI